VTVDFFFSLTVRYSGRIFAVLCHINVEILIDRFFVDLTQSLEHVVGIYIACVKMEKKKLNFAGKIACVKLFLIC
jgi:hypothetical protein